MSAKNRKHGGNTPRLTPAYTLSGSDCILLLRGDCLRTMTIGAVRRRPFV